MFNIAAILARTSKGVVGKSNKLPWHLPEELKLFKKISSDYVNMVMGRKTYESLPKLLPNRNHIVLTKDKQYKAKQSVIIVNSVQSILNNYTRFIVIGGPSTIATFMPYIEKFYMSELHKEYIGDTYFIDKLFNFEVTSIKEYGDFTHYELSRRSNDF